jgi:hypothetical protein
MYIYCVSSVFYLHICFILLLRDPIFLTPFSKVVARLDCMSSWSIVFSEYVIKGDLWNNLEGVSNSHDNGSEMHIP